MGHFDRRNGNFPCCEPGHRGDPMDLGSFPTQPIPNNFSRNIREIFKILTWEDTVDAQKGKFHFFGPPVHLPLYISPFGFIGEKLKTRIAGLSSKLGEALKGANDVETSVQPEEKTTTQ